MKHMYICLRVRARVLTYSTVTKVAGLRLDEYSSILCKDRHFSLYLTSKTTYGVHIISYPICHRRSLLGFKVDGARI
jgi:hypothetical protein